MITQCIKHVFAALGKTQISQINKQKNPTKHPKIQTKQQVKHKNAKPQE